MTARSAGALDCGGRQPSVKTKKHSSWPQIIGEVLLEVVTSSQIAEVIKGVREPFRVSKKKGSVFQFTEEWEPHVLEILTDKNTLLQMAILMHQQRLKSEDPSSFISGILMKNMNTMASHPELLEAVLLLCKWSVAFSTNMNLFPIKFDSIHKRGPPHYTSSGLAPGDYYRSASGLENAFVGKFWRCMGETGLFLVPTALRQLEISQLTDRLTIQRVEFVDKLKLLGAEGSLLVHPGLIKEGFCARLKQLEEKTVLLGFDRVSQWFSKLRETVGSIEFGETKGKRIYFAHLQNKIKDALKGGQLMDHKVLNHVMGYLIGYMNSPYLLSFILEAIMGLKSKESESTDIVHLEKYTERITGTMRSVLVDMYSSIENCRSDVHNVQTAAALQVRLLYPQIVFESLHTEIRSKHYLKRIPRRVFSMRDRQRRYARKYIKFLTGQLSKLNEEDGLNLTHPVSSNPQSQVDQTRALMRLVLIELVSHCIRKNRIGRAKVHLHAADVVLDSSASHLLANMDKLRNDIFLKYRLNQDDAQLRNNEVPFMGIPLIFKKKNGNKGCSQPTDSHSRSC